MPVRFLDERIAISTEIQDLFRDANEICCIVAFWGSGAEKMFSGMNECKVKRIKIVCNLPTGIWHTLPVHCDLAAPDGGTYQLGITKKG